MTSQVRESGWTMIHNLSALVSEYLNALPVDAPLVVRSPVARRLYGTAKRTKARPADYHEHLARKHGVD